MHRIMFDLNLGVIRTDWWAKKDEVLAGPAYLYTLSGDLQHDGPSLVSLLFLWSTFFNIPTNDFDLVVAPRQTVIQFTNNETPKYLCFRTKALADHWASWAEKIVTNRGLFERLPDGTAALTSVRVDVTDTLTVDQNTFEEVHIITEKDVDYYKWIMHNCHYSVYKLGDRLLFTNADEAMLFKLAKITC